VRRRGPGHPEGVPRSSGPGAAGASRATVAAWMAVGIAAISCSPILVRVAALPALALAFWRCAAGAALLAPFVRRAEPGGSIGRAEAARLLAAGVFLAVHFGLWNASLALTSVAASTTLVSCSPLFVGLGGRLLGEPPGRRAWVGIALAVAGAAVIGLGDAARTDVGGRALLGDALAFAGSAAVAGYLLLGRAARRRLPVSTYAASVYGVAAAVLLPACLLTGAALGGYRAGSWLALAAVVAGPQLLGHTVFNGLLARVSATVVAVAILTEPVGATALAWLLLDELPTAAFWLGAPLVLAGVWLTVTGERERVGTAGATS
jgi:drug/metabolite transporter (DMT)-like permease